MKKDKLNTLELGEQAKIVVLNCTGSLRRRLLDLGLVKNTEITPILRSPSGNPTAYEVRGSVIALREEDSKHIQIEKCEL
ncbi:MAG: ferrous iron transport protein A [Clostridia bacterium]|nr:ferrous iron transport protein A [Clostridia bacterium]